MTRMIAEHDTSLCSKLLFSSLEKYMSDNPARVFATTRDTVTALVHSCPKIVEYPKDGRKGIYLLYVNHFENEMILPIYVGKGVGKGGVQKRYFDHLHHLIAMNRYSGKDYRHVLVERSTLDGRFLYPKMLKYIADCGLSLSDVSCILLEECDAGEAPERERHWIDELHAAFFGFNQINSKTMAPAIQSSNLEEHAAEHVKMIVSDLECCKQYWGYGFTDFNFRYTLDMGNVLICDPNAWHEKKGLINEIRNADSWGQSIYEAYRDEMQTLCDKYRTDINLPERTPKDVQVFFLRQLMYHNDEVRRVRRSLLKTWRETLLPKDVEYDFCPMGDRFKTYAFPEPSCSRRTCQIRLELSGPAPRLLRRTKLRQQPEIIRVDYRFLDAEGCVAGFEGGSFIDCDVMRHIADPIITYRLKAELMRESIRTHGWYSWMTPHGNDWDEATLYLWRFSPALADGLWNDNGPSYGNEYERTVGINKHTLRGQQLHAFDEFFMPILEEAIATKCRIEVFSNAGKELTKKVLHMQLAGGNVFVEDIEAYMRQEDLGVRMVFHKSSPRIIS